MIEVVKLERDPPRRRKPGGNAEAKKRRDQLTDVDAKLDRAMGRVVTWSSKMADLRAKRKRIIRELAKLLAK